MKFIKGQSGNPAGKKKGTTSKKNRELQAFICDLILKDKATIKETYKSLGGMERLKFLSNMAPYIMPRLSSVEMQSDFSQMSEDQLDKIIETLKQTVIKAA